MLRFVSIRGFDPIPRKAIKSRAPRMMRIRAEKDRRGERAHPRISASSAVRFELVHSDGRAESAAVLCLISPVEDDKASGTLALRNTAVAVVGPREQPGGRWQGRHIYERWERCGTCVLRD